MSQLVFYEKALVYNLKLVANILKKKLFLALQNITTEMIAKNIFFLCFFAVSTIACLQAQDLAPESVNAAGKKMTQSSGSLSFTVGELVILTFIDSLGNSIGQGFGNASTALTPIIEPDAKLLRVNVYPNPSADLFFVDVIESQLDIIKIDIVSIDGKLLSSEKYASWNNHIGINTEKWLSGIYFLQLKDKENRIVGTYKVVKK